MTIYYMAQVASVHNDASPIFSKIHGNALMCYFDEHMHIESMSKYFSNLFLDSGAFSVDSMNVRVDINEYSEFLRLHSEKFDAYANLDVIHKAEETLKNQKYLESQGLNPLPVFHMDEDMKFLDDYVGSYDYVGLGGIAKSSIKKNKWLESIFAKYPDHKFHGFGVGSIKSIQKYPFYSVDSTTWLRDGSMGMLLFKDLPDCHYNKLTDDHKKVIYDLGFSEEILKREYLARYLFNLMTIKNMLNNISQKTFDLFKYNDITEELIS